MAVSSKISIIIPTLNAGRVLPACLKSIKSQKTKYRYEILIIDGGSNDNTLKIAKKFGAKIYQNPLKTAEAGKAVGVKKATGNFISLIDSDNILPDKNWLNLMMSPFADKDIIGSEPIKFTYRQKAGLIERYSALIGANDPFAFITGIYDRQNFINFKWTNLKIEIQNFKDYLKIKLNKNKPIPTIGANGTIFRKEIFNNFNKKYLFDIDVLSSYIKKNNVYFAKVKTGIIHTYCENNIKKFIRKQNRRIVDFYTWQKYRTYNWSNSNPFQFIFYTILIIPMFYHLIIGYFHKPDTAWFFHPLACFITLYVYCVNFVKNKLNLIKPLDRNQWQQ